MGKEKMMNKIFGYLLICAGLLLVFFALIGMYKVFVNGNAVMPIIQLADMQLNTAYGPVVIPMKSLSSVVNLMLFALFMAFVLSAGAKVAGVGNGMLKAERIYDALRENPSALQNKEQVNKL